MALDWARALQGCQLHHQSCNPLDPRGKAEAWSTEDNLAKNCGSGNKEHEPKLGHHPETGRDRHGGGASLLPYTPAGITDIFTTTTNNNNNNNSVGLSLHNETGIHCVLGPDAGLGIGLRVRIT